MPNFGNTTTPGTGFFFDDFGNCNFASNIGNMPSPGGYITDMYLYISGDGGSDSCWFMIWNGSNGNVIFESGATSIPSGSRSIGGQAWRHTTIPNPPYVASGTTLYVGIWSNGGAVWTYESSGSVMFQRSISAGGHSFSSGGTEGSGAFGAYITYTAVNAPTTSSISPTVGNAGTSMTITGTGFTYATSVSINGASASFSINSDTSITATVPNGASYGNGNVTVTNPTGTSNAQTFYDGSAPTVSSYTPSAGPIGTVVSVVGTGFLYVSGVTVAGTSASFSITDDDHMTFTIPTVTHGYQTFIITNPAGTYSNTEFVGTAPNITSVTPSTAAPGQNIELAGSEFDFVTACAVNGVNAAFDAHTDIDMTVTIPSGVSGGLATVSATNPTGTGTFSFTVGGIARGRRSGAWVVVPPQGRRSGAWVSGIEVQGRRSGSWTPTS